MKAAVLRMRRVGERTVLTYKERLQTRSDVKRQKEFETEVTDANACESILQSLGFHHAGLYEKWREVWTLGTAEIVIDKLPFGDFMEIEARASAIRKVEQALAINGLKVEHLTYPQLTRKYGEIRGKVIEARFNSKKD
jgi:adenylate cyclase class 2